MKKLFLISAFLISSSVCLASSLEKDYNNYWCGINQGIREYKTIDGSYVDCLLPDYAVEGERASKWKEAVGQSLFYGIQTHRKPAVLLIVEDANREKKYIDRLNIVSNLYGIKIWYITPSELPLRRY